MQKRMSNRCLKYYSERPYILISSTSDNNRTTDDISQAFQSTWRTLTNGRLFSCVMGTSKYKHDHPYHVCKTDNMYTSLYIYIQQLNCDGSTLLKEVKCSKHRRGFWFPNYTLLLCFVLSIRSDMNKPVKNFYLFNQYSVSKHNQREIIMHKAKHKLSTLLIHLQPLFSHLHVLLAITEQLINQTSSPSKHLVGKINLDRQTK